MNITYEYVVELYEGDDVSPCECLPDFYYSVEAAEAAGAAEVARVAAIEPADRDPTLDFATSYLVKPVLYDGR